MNIAHQEFGTPVVLTVPGLNNSGPAHWQSVWERERGDCQRAELGLWSRPHRNTWVSKLNTAIRQAGRPVILAAHSLGCLAVAWWAALENPPFGQPVAGALLVAPPNVDSVSEDLRLVGFGPAPKSLLPFPSIVVASRNDPYISFDRAHNLAKFWGSHCVDAGEAGHINAESRLGDWQYGQYLLDRLIQIATQSSPGGDHHAASGFAQVRQVRDDVVPLPRTYL